MNKSEITIKTPSAELVFSWDDERNEWSTIQYFFGWAGFHCENSLPELKNGQSYIIIDSLPDETPSDKHTQALAWLLEQPDAASQIVLNAIYKIYPSQKQSLSEYFDTETLNLLYPDLNKITDLKALLSLSRIHIYVESRDGLPYLGFDLACNWDVEHGVQVLLNGPRIVAVGTDALNPYNIDQDGGEI